MLGRCGFTLLDGNCIKGNLLPSFQIGQLLRLFLFRRFVGLPSGNKHRLSLGCELLPLTFQRYHGFRILVGLTYAF